MSRVDIRVPVCPKHDIRFPVCPEHDVRVPVCPEHDIRVPVCPECSVYLQSTDYSGTGCFDKTFIQDSVKHCPCTSIQHATTVACTEQFQGYINYTVSVKHNKLFIILEFFGHPFSTPIESSSGLSRIRSKIK